MKKVLTLIFIIFTINCTAQLDTSYFSTPNAIYLGGSSQLNWVASDIRSVDVISKYDTVVLNKGNLKCKHHFVSKDVRDGLYSKSYSCLVNHGAEGCPDTWLHEKQICALCLRHIEVTETRSAKVVIIVDEYEEALKKLNKQNDKNN
jgi:hypothetical protein